MSLGTWKRGLAMLGLTALIAGTAACSDFSGADIEATTHDQTDDSEKRNTLFGEGGISLWGDSNSDTSGGALGVNSFLWRASLDTISFMPLASADPFGGVLITDWYSAPETPGERMKLTVYILDRQLRADGIRVAAFKQRRDETGKPLWPGISAAVSGDFPQSRPPAKAGCRPPTAPRRAGEPSSSEGRAHASPNPWAGAGVEPAPGRQLRE